MGVAATEGAVAGASGGASAAQNRAGGAAATGAGSPTTGTGSSGVGNQPALQQRSAAPPGAEVRGKGGSSGTSQTIGQAQAESIRGDFSKALERDIPSQSKVNPIDETSASSHAPTNNPDNGHAPQAYSPSSSSVSSKASGRSNNANHRGPSSQLMRPHGLATWGAYHAARLAARGAAGGVRSAASAVKSAASSAANPVETAGKLGTRAGSIASTAVNAVEKTASAAGTVTRAVTHPRETISASVGSIGNAVRVAATNLASTAQRGAHSIKSNFSEAYDKGRSGEQGGNKEYE